MNGNPSKRERITVKILCSLINSERYLEHLIIQGRQDHLDMDFMIKTARIMADKVIEELGEASEDDFDNFIVNSWQSAAIDIGSLSKLKQKEVSYNVSTIRNNISTVTTKIDEKGKNNE